MTIIPIVYRLRKTTAIVAVLERDLIHSWKHAILTAMSKICRLLLRYDHSHSLVKTLS